jgi:dolichyl-diphosphooligosaccharide--protein glycosyltransferase
MNTEPDAVVASWWDYGYQIAGMADRPTLVDNNTWNNSARSLFLALSPAARTGPGRRLTHALRPTQPTLPPSARPCRRPRRSRTRSSRSTTSPTYSSSLAASSATLGASRPAVPCPVRLRLTALVDGSDDINKFLWMVRIAQGVWPEEIQERNYFTPRGEYKVDSQAFVQRSCIGLREGRLTLRASVLAAPRP